MLTEQEKSEFRQNIQSNKHEIFVISFEDMDAVIKSSPASKKESVQQAWNKVKGKAETGASYYASADDVRTLTKLVGELGSFTAKAYVKTYGGKPHIILKGHPGLRKILTGTKYGVSNPKVVTMGLGKAGAVHAAKSGGILSIVLISAYRIADYVLTDESTLTQLIGSLATDVVKVGISTAASIGAASLVAAMGVTIAVGPIVAVILIGVGTSMALSAMDSHYGITEKVIAGLDELTTDAQSTLEQTRKNLIKGASKVVDSVIDYAVESTRKAIIDFARHSLDKFLSPLPRSIK